jgi:competence protein ComEC
VEAQLTTSTTGRHNVGEVSIQILAPVPELAIMGVGGKDLKDKRLRANSMSAVVSLAYKARRIAILAGDLDQVGLENLSTEDVDLKAEILVFPHHGGKPGAGVNSEAFAQRLCKLVQPRLVIFSIDRSLHKNPDEGIIQGVFLSTEKTHIMCTQLSKKCAVNLPKTNPPHLSTLPAKGLTERKCCGGTILIKFGEDENVYTPSLNKHEEFVAQYPDSICQKLSCSIDIEC